MFCFEPGQRLLVVHEGFGRDAGAGRGECQDRHAMGVEQQGGGMAGVQVVIQHAARCRAGLSCAVACSVA